MITGIEIQNFKGIGERQSIDFAPLTLLFGANSAGKSTVVQAIHYFGQALRTGNGDVDEIESTDRLLRLGGFENLVHQKNEEPGITIRLSVRAERLDQFAVNLYGCAPLFKGLDLEQLPKLFPQVNSVGIEITTKKLLEGHLNRADHPLVERLVLFIDGEQFLETEATAFIYDEQVIGRIGNIANINFNHFLLKENGSGEQLRKWASSVNFSAEPVDLNDEIDGLPTEISSCLGAIPTRESIAGGLYYLDVNDLDRMKEAGHAQLKSILLGLLLDSIEYVQRMVGSVAHVGPLREIPSRDMVSVNDSNLRSWYRGQAAWKKLAKKDPGFGTTSLCLKMDGSGPAFELNLQELLGAPYVLRRIGIWESTESDWNDGRSRYSIQSGLKIVLEDLRSNTIVALEDVGVGIAQCIPVITAAREQLLPILFIEQPELHLHPRQQAMLADVFVNQLGRSSRWWETRNGVQSEERTIVLETHSELVLLRLLRRIRDSKAESASELSKKTASASPRISSDDLRVYAVENIEGSTKFRCLPISKSGDIVGGWPEGFFDERMDEVL